MKRKKTETVAALEYMRTMPTSRWAWEFLRRNPDYENEYSCHANGALKQRREGNLDIYNLQRPEPEAEKWGLIFFADPDNNSQTAPVFWTMEANPRVIGVETVPRQKGDPKSLLNTIFDLRLFGATRIHLTDGYGKEHLLLLRGNRVVQMHCEGHTLLNGDVELRFILEGFGSLDAKIDTIRRLAQLYDKNSGANPTLRDGWSSKTASLRDALIALDVYQTGGNHVDTAVAIYGQQAVDDQYYNSDSSLKNKMYRARRRGIELMEGGYKALMQNT